MYLLHRKKIDIYANISLCLSYSEVTVATRSSPYPDQTITAVNRSSPYPDQMITAVNRSSPYPDQMITAVNRSSPYPDQMVDQHLETTSTASPYSPERQRRPGHLDEPQIKIPRENHIT